MTVLPVSKKELEKFRVSRVNTMAGKLPTFRGYTVDMRSQQFRRILNPPYGRLEFIPFASERGEKVWREYMKFEIKAGRYII